jgi:hypothetical protein
LEEAAKIEANIVIGQEAGTEHNKTGKNDGKPVQLLSANSALLEVEEGND